MLPLRSAHTNKISKYYTPTASNLVRRAPYLINQTLKNQGLSSLRVRDMEVRNRLVSFFVA